MTEKMQKMIADFPQQLLEAHEIALQVALSRKARPLRQVLICGMGGSGIGADYIQRWCAAQAKPPVFVHKGYDAPAWAGSGTLAICSSYSGNTEETLQAAEGLHAAGAVVVCVTSGGKLADFARANGLDTVALPSGWSSPRACLGFSIGAQAGVLAAHGVLKRSALAELKKSSRLLSKSATEIRNQAQLLANSIAGKMPIIYAPDHLESVALRWRQQINENAKQLCWHHVIPEMNHNELVGWTEQAPDKAVLWLRDPEESPRVHQRMRITREITSHFAGATAEIRAKGDSLLQRMLYLTHFGDWLSVMLAEARKVDPVEIRVIDFLKNELAAVKS